MSSTNSDDDLVQKVLDYQSMIEITAKSLDGLRKQCTQTNDLIQSEILEKEVIIFMCLQLPYVPYFDTSKIPGFPS